MLARHRSKFGINFIDNAKISFHRKVLFVAEKLLLRCDDHRLDDLLGEWKRYQAFTDLPNFMDLDPIDIWWQQVLHSKDATGEDIYTLLVLPYPISN